MDTFENIPEDDSGLTLEQFVAYYKAYTQLRRLFESQNDILKKYYGNY